MDGDWVGLCHRRVASKTTVALTVTLTMSSSKHPPNDSESEDDPDYVPPNEVGMWNTTRSSVTCWANQVFPRLRFGGRRGKYQ